MAFSNKFVEKIPKYFWKSLFFNECENHSGCPIGRLGASRTSSSGNGSCHDLETEGRIGDEPYYASNKKLTRYRFAVKFSRRSDL